MSEGHSCSDEDEDIVVLRVCANRGCHRTDNIEVDEETGELYCGYCRELFARTETEGFGILLTEVDRPLVRLIFNAFDEGKKGYWDYKNWAKFQSFTDHPPDCEIDSDTALKAFFATQYDIELRRNHLGVYVVTLDELEAMYGGFFFNHIDALNEDSAALEDGGVINTETLE